LGFVTTALLSLIASAIVELIAVVTGWYVFIIILLIGTGAGALMARAVLAVLRKRRSRLLFWVIASGVVAGAFPVILFLLFGGDYFAILYQVIYLVTATPTVYTQVSGIQITR
jgi:hypothetical protein